MLLQLISQCPCHPEQTGRPVASSIDKKLTLEVFKSTISKRRRRPCAQVKPAHTLQAVASIWPAAARAGGITLCILDWRHWGAVPNY